MYVFVASLLGLLLQLPPENEDDDDDDDGDGDGDGAVLRYASMFVRERRESVCVCVRLLSLGVCHKEVSRSRVRWSRVL